MGALKGFEKLSRKFESNYSWNNWKQNHEVHSFRKKKLKKTFCWIQEEDLKKRIENGALYDNTIGNVIDIEKVFDDRLPNFGNVDHWKIKTLWKNCW